MACALEADDAAWLAGWAVSCGGISCHLTYGETFWQDENEEEDDDEEEDDESFKGEGSGSGDDESSSGEVSSSSFRKRSPVSQNVSL